MMDEYEREKRTRYKKDKLVRAVAFAPGIVMPELVLLDDVMNMYLAKHFCPEQPLSNQFIEIIIKQGRMNFGIKRKLLTWLLKENKFNRIDEFRRDTKIIIECRNIFANDLTDWSPEAIEQYKQEHLKVVDNLQSGSYRWDKAQYDKLLSLTRKWIGVFTQLTGGALPVES